MKALFVNVSSVGHVVPTLELVRHLTERDVAVTYMEIDAHRAELEAAGARFVPMKDLVDYTGPHGPQLAALPAVLSQCAIEATADVLDVIAREQPDVVVHDSLCLWGRLAADLAGVTRFASVASAALSRRMLTEDPVMLAWQKAAGDIEPFKTFTADCWNTLHTRYGVAVEDEISTVLNRAPCNIVHLSRSLQPCDTDFGDDYLFCGSGQPRRHVEQTFDWSRVGGRRMVYMSFGTAHDPGREFYQAVARAMAQVDAVLVVVDSPSMYDPEPIAWPEGTVVCPNGSAPQIALLERADLFISHVGGGAVREAAWCATPILGLPQTLEQEMLCGRLIEQGVAVQLESTPGAEAIANALRRMLDDDVMRGHAEALKARQQIESSYEPAIQALTQAMRLPA